MLTSNGEWRIVIRSDDLQHKVIGRVNENWQPGTKVQFYLDPEKFEPTVQLGRMAHNTFFELQRDHSDESIPWEERQWVKTPKWLPNMFPTEV